MLRLTSKSPQGYNAKQKMIVCFAFMKENCKELSAAIIYLLTTSDPSPKLRPETLPPL